MLKKFVLVTKILTIFMKSSSYVDEVILQIEMSKYDRSGVAFFYL